MHESAKPILYLSREEADFEGLRDYLLEICYLPKKEVFIELALLEEHTIGDYNSCMYVFLPFTDCYHRIRDLQVLLLGLRLVKIFVNTS